MKTNLIWSRRNFIQRASLAAGLLAAPGLFAEELMRRTASVEEGPFYPYNKLPLDTDNDLIIVNDSITPAVGEITHLSGRLLKANGSPVSNATIEIWEVDHTGVYLADRGHQAKYDANFQGFGRFLTGSSGEYYFRTIKPVSYPGRRAPHIHFKVKMKGQEAWTTQLFIKGFAGNDEDGLWRSIRGQDARDSVSTNFVPVPGSRIGELSAHFDIVLGLTA
jgi:protocatechuate 3,4-dioxygenase beta subunit